jgi:hypothetical protein
MSSPLKEWNTAKLGYTFLQPTFYSSAHLGVDHVVPVNTPIYAWGDITVHRAVGNDMGITAHCTDKYGKFTRIGHCNEVYAGKKKLGDVIGLSGNTGRLTTGPHTHTDVSYNKLQLSNLDNFIDPMIYFKTPMKVKIIALNYTDKWITKERLQPVVDFFPVRIDFDIEYRTDNDLQWEEANTSRVKVGSMWLGTWKGKYWDDAYDCVVVTMGQNDWKGNVYGNILGDAFRLKEDTGYIHGINLLGNSNGKRENWGWNNNDQFTGTLRHELMHTLFQMARLVTKDSTHKHDYESRNIGLALKDIDFSRITFKEPVQAFDPNNYRGKVIRNTNKPEHYYVSEVTGKVVHIPNEDWFTIGVEKGLWKSWSDAIIIKEDITI